jgi:hypothetical protein
MSAEAIEILGRTAAPTTAPAANRRPDPPPFPAEILRVERIGLGYRSELAAGIELKLTRIRGSREVTGELMATWMNRAGHAHIYAGNFNASSPTQRTSTSKELARTCLDADAWRSILEAFCVGVLAEHRRPAEIVDLGALGPRIGSRTLIGDVMLSHSHINTLMATEGTGKTTLAQAIAVMLRSGVVTIPGLQPSITGPVLVIDYESTPEDWAEGIGAIAAGVGIEPPQIDYLPCAWQGALSDHIEDIAAKVAPLKPVLVIVDSNELAAGAGHEGDSFEARTQRLYAALKLLRTTVLVIDHLASTEREGGGPASKAYGSVFKMAWSRQVWELKREKAPTADRAELLLLNTKYNAGPKSKPIGLAFNYGPGRLAIERTDVLAPELLSSLPMHERMTRLLRNGSLAVPAIAQELDKSEAYVRQLASRYKDRFIHLPDRRIGIAERA